MCYNTIRDEELSSTLVNRMSIHVYQVHTQLKLNSVALVRSELYRQSGRRRSAKLVPTFADRGVSRGQRNGSPRPLISVF